MIMLEVVAVSCVRSAVHYALEVVEMLRSAHGASVDNGTDTPGGGTSRRLPFKRRRLGFLTGYALAVALIALALVAVFAAPAYAGEDGPALAPINPAFVASVLAPPMGPLSSEASSQPLGERPGPQDFSYTRGMQVPSFRAFETLPATYDLRPLGRVTSVKNQNPYGTCWSFAACGSLESGLLPGETRDFSEDNMVLNSGFDTGPNPYNTGGQIFMSTAYLVRWNGPVYETDDAYGDSSTPAGLSARKHVQEINWIPPRGTPVDNANIKNAVMQYGGADVSTGWYDGSSYYNATTASYYYDGTSGTNHEVVIVGWDDNYAASNFATTPAGNGAFIV